MTAKPSVPRERSFLRANAPSVALAGLVLLGTSLFLLGVLANSAHAVHYEATGEPVATNGTARFTLAVTGHFAIPYDSFVEASYRFPVAPGDAYFLDCWAYLDLIEGRPLGADAQVIRGRREAQFRAPVEDIINLPTVPPAAPGEPGAFEIPSACPGLYAVFEWPATGDWRANRPDASARFVANALASSPLSIVLPALAALGAAAALAGGLLWRSGRQARGAEPAAERDESTAEALHLFAARTEAWLVRTRRYLIVAGVLGVFLWYPLLLPWAWRAASDVGGAWWARWAFVAGAVILLAALTTFWAREFLRLDREVAEWRERMARLKRREEELLAELES